MICFILPVPVCGRADQIDAADVDVGPGARGAFRRVRRVILEGIFVNHARGGHKAFCAREAESAAAAIAGAEAVGGAGSVFHAQYVRAPAGKVK